MMMGLLDQYRGDPSYRIFKISLGDLLLDDQVTETGPRRDQVLGGILEAVGSSIYQAQASGEGLDLEFVLKESSLSVAELEARIGRAGLTEL